MLHTYTLLHCLSPYGQMPTQRATKIQLARKRLLSVLQMKSLTSAMSSRDCRSSGMTVRYKTTPLSRRSASSQYGATIYRCNGNLEGA